MGNNMEYIIENKYLNNLFAVFVITIAASLDAFVINAFISNANLISTGFTGLALLLNSLSNSLPFTIDVSMMIIMLIFRLLFYVIKRLVLDLLFYRLTISSFNVL